MNIPIDFPKDVADKLKLVETATAKNMATVEALKKQVTPDDVRKAMNTTGIESPKYSTKSTAGLANIAPEAESFFSKNKFLIIGAVVLLVAGISFYYFKKH